MNNMFADHLPVGVGIFQNLSGDFSPSSGASISLFSLSTLSLAFAMAAPGHPR
jgi:hypothetical protein